LYGFDAHRIGKHAYSLRKGLAMEPPREDGRRCLDADELRERGFTLDSRRRWRRPASGPRPWAAT